MCEPAQENVLSKVRQVCVLTNFLQDGPESLENRSTRRAMGRLQEQQQKTATKMRKVAEQSNSDRRKVSCSCVADATNVLELLFRCCCT